MSAAPVLAVLPASIPLALCLLGISFVFTGVEAGLLAVNPARLRTRARGGDKPAQRLERLLSHPERLLATALLVTNFMDLAALALITGRAVAAFGLRGYVLALVVALPTYLIGVRLLPKALFRRFPVRTLAALAGLLELTSRLATPLLAFGASLSRALGLGRAFDPLRLSIAREQFQVLLTGETATAGVLTPLQREIIARSLAFRRLPVGECKLALPPTSQVPAGARVTDLLRLVGKSDVSAATEEGSGKIRVLERVKELVFDRDPNQRVDRLPEPFRMAQSEPAHRVLRKLRAERREVALITDERGNPVGYATADHLVQVMLGGRSERREKKGKPN